MIKATELRIGSWVKTTEIHGKEIVHQVEARDVFAIAMNESSWCPIPISAEWMKNFGFKDEVTGEEVPEGEKSTPLLSFEKRTGEYGQEKVVFITLFSSLYTEDLWELTPGNGFRCLNYVHELQNYYFAITGEELMIKDSL